MQPPLNLLYQIGTTVVRLLHYYAHYAVYIVSYYIRREFTKKSARKDLPFLEDITQVTNTVTRVLGQNPGPFTLQGTNTYLVGNGRKKILVDCGGPQQPEYIVKLREALGESQIEKIICTHWHRDHIGGLPAILEHISPKIPVFKKKRNDQVSEQYPTDNISFTTNGDLFTIDDSTLEVIDTPGHTCDHISLWMEKEGIIFSGDCILGGCSSTFSDLTAYMASLEKLLSLNARFICTGHGILVENPRETIQGLIEHRISRERKIFSLFNTDQPKNPIEILNLLYKSSRLPFSLRMGALMNINQHLQKLCNEGNIKKCGRLDYILS